MLAVTAGWIALGRLHDWQHEDSIVHVLVSLQRWTLFGWEQERIGMLVPLLAMPVRHPLGNLVTQAALNAFASLAASFLLVRYLLGATPFWMCAAALANAWLLLLVPKQAQFEWLVGLPQYGVGIALGLVALLALDRKSTVGAVISMVVAGWQNATIAIVLLPLVIIRRLIDRERDRLMASGLLLGAGTLAGWLLMRAAPRREIVMSFDPPAQWLSGWLGIADMIRQYVLPDRPGFVLIAGPAILGLLLLRFRPPLKARAVVVAGTLALAAMGYALLMGTLSWVRINLYAPRYVAPALLFAALALMVASAGVSYGLPSIRGINQDLDRRLGWLTPDILASGAVVVAGSSTVVWPAVFHANLTLYRRGAGRTVYGLTYRSAPTRPFWISRKPLCAAVPLGDREAKEFMARTGRSFQRDARYNTVERLCAP